MSAERTRVLVIDDNADLRDLIRATLEYEGFEVSSAADGARGLESLRRAPAQVVVTDIFMPEKEGMETLMALREEFPRTKVVAMSGGGAREGVDYLALAVGLGASRTFRKPFDLHELAAAVRDLAKPQA